MGRQMAFYFTTDDEERFLATLLRRAPVAILTNYLYNGTPITVAQLPLVKLLDEDTYVFSISNLDTKPRYKTAEDDANYIDISRSEVIELRRCVSRDGKTLESGRLWFDPTTSTGRPKRACFVQWASAVLRDVKKMCHYSEAHFGHFGPDAWYQHKAKSLRTSPS